MEKEKESALNYAIDRIYGIGFGLESEELIESYFDEKLMALGTTVDERFFTLDGVRKLIRHQKEQTAGMEISFDRKEFYRDIRADGKVAITVEDVTANVKMGSELITFDVRSSAILEYKNESWKLVHWHASKPELVESETDTFGIEEWKQKNAALEKLVAERTADLANKNEQLETAIASLKATQSQLIQSEKMASLGELTAGIAHEIQNPLNFVNNFSEVSIELLDEIEVESRKAKVERDDDLISEIHYNIKQNLEKISHHGKRADSIVKGMLQHSQTTSGIKEPTNINALIDEYLRLAFHGLRAKDKNFNVELVTNFTTDLQAAMVVPQDIGRVLLNLFMNAFYATQQRKADLALEGDTQTEYKPVVEVGTSVNGNFIEIKIKDNGSGILENIKEKIFQPFFTTKPTGQGTGLGLSLAYDIVKAHGGELKLQTDEKVGTLFIILLPC